MLKVRFSANCLNDLNCGSPICPDHGYFDLWEGIPADQWGDAIPPDRVEGVNP